MLREVLPFLSKINENESQLLFHPSLTTCLKHGVYSVAVIDLTNPTVMTATKQKVEVKFCNLLTASMRTKKSLEYFLKY